MNKRNRNILIIIIIMVALLVAGGSYAFWLWTSNVNKNVVFNTMGNFEDYIVYSEGDSYFIGNFQPTDTFCESTNTTISFYKKEDMADMDMFATIKMDINSIGSNITESNDVYWIVTSGDSSITCEDALGSSSVLSYGTFNGVVAGDTLTLLSDVEVLLTEQIYTVWIWIDNSGTDLTMLSGETVDTNIWTEFEIMGKKNFGVFLDANGGDLNYVTFVEEYNSIGSYSFVAPYSYTYKIELWGASGGQYSNYTSGKGGYTSGYILLNENTNLYIYVGGSGSVGSRATGGYNGGGTAADSNNNGSGGGATDVRLVSGDWNNSSSLNSRIMVAGGGGGSAYYSSYYGYGGSGGGLIGYDGTSTNASTRYGGGGTQIGYGNFLKGSVAGFGYGGYYDTSYSGVIAGGGGSGYYGGNPGGDYGAGGGGGSSYISGHAGCIAITSRIDTTPKTTSYSTITDSYHYSGKVFSDTVMIDGNGYNWTTEKGDLQQMPNPDGGYYESGVGNSGDGFARVSIVNSIFLTNGDKYGELPTPTRTGYNFLGWYTEADGGTLITRNTKFDLKENSTLYAHWSALPTYTISFDANGGTGAPDAQIKIEDTDLILTSSIPTRTGYTFLGWSTDSEATSIMYEAGATFDVDADTTLYAVWSELNEVSNVSLNVTTRTYYQNGGSGASGGYVGVAAASNNFVVRYTFTTSATQKASKVSLVIYPYQFITGSGQQLRFYITTSSTSHANANSTSYDYTGKLSAAYGSYTVGSFTAGAKLTGSGSVTINPSTTYYLWVFGTSTTTTGYFDFESGSYVPTATLTLNPS